MIMPLTNRLQKFLNFSGSPELKNVYGKAGSRLGWMSACIVGLAVGWVGEANAQTAAPTTLPPEELSQMIREMDAAASQEDAETLMRFYSRDFTHADGLAYRDLETALTGFWEAYADLSYQTVIDRWRREDNGLMAETTTTITGTQIVNGLEFALTSTVRSRQQYVDGKVVSQEILSEQSQLMAGANPPDVSVYLPGQVRIGQAFNFDVIVQEPLGDRVLLGAAIEEPITAQNYLTPAPVNLELLPAGGLFKVGRAPALPDDRWISGIIIRDDGIVALTRRLHILSR